MGHRSEAFVGMDTSKLRHAVAVAEEGRGGDVRYLGEIDTMEATTRKLVAKLAAKSRPSGGRTDGLFECQLRRFGREPKLFWCWSTAVQGGRKPLYECRIGLRYAVAGAR